jgi:hypothetical protein
LVAVLVVAELVVAMLVVAGLVIAVLVIAVLITSARYFYEEWHRLLTICRVIRLILLVNILTTIGYELVILMREN